MPLVDSSSSPWKQPWLLVGALAWVATLVFSPLAASPWVARILLAAPLLLIPGGRHFEAQGGRRMWAALPLLWAYASTPGWWAAVWALPWLLSVSWDVYQAPQRWSANQVARLYLWVGAIWLVADRLGWPLLGFDPLIVLLTAVHFHYAGFLLPQLAAKLQPLTDRPATLAWARWLVLAGMPFTAAGIQLARWGWGAGWELPGATLTVVGGALVAWLYWRTASHLLLPAFTRWCWQLGALALFAGMALGLAYGWRSVWLWPWLSIPWMYTWHGLLNSLGFAGLLTLGWLRHDR